MKRILTAMTVVAPLLLAACGGATTGAGQMGVGNSGVSGGGGQPGGGSSGGSGGGGGQIETPPAITTNRNVLQITQDRNGAAYSVPIPDTPATGGANFRGGMLADVTVNGKSGQVLFANIDASANLFDGTFGGTIRNFNIADANLNPTEGVRGQLTFTGSSNGIKKTVTATAKGNLVGNFGGNTTETVNMAIDLNGRVRGPTIFNNMEMLNGSVSGGSTANQPYNVDLDGDFYISQEFANN